MNANEIKKVAKEIREGRNNRTFEETRDIYLQAVDCFNSGNFAEVTKNILRNSLELIRSELERLMPEAVEEQREDVPEETCENIQDIQEEQISDNEKEEKREEDLSKSENNDSMDNKIPQNEEPIDNSRRHNFKTILKMMEDEGKPDPILASIRWFAVVYCKDNCSTIKYVRGMLTRRGYEVGENGDKVTVAHNGSEVAEIKEQDGMVVSFDII